ncbi:hypothetical protein N0V82_010413 [Gnomoniopsis sp. IMI 355080]|nr:hypothetical protein N0V82_010413 [Gnomoniopsis sp. IMI 355080]
MATGIPTSPTAIVPAHVGFLAIFNPSLGHSDETLDDQIVYYSSVDSGNSKRRRSAARGSSARPTENLPQAERNERLRQIGLAQGMVSFGKSFSDDQDVDTIETEKTRVVLHELEPGWWILACIDLTRLPLPQTSKKSNTTETPSEEEFEYSSREVKPAVLLLRDLLRAHCNFLLHHDSSLSALFVRIKRPKFISTLARYWDLFLSTWNVLLSGNPVRDVFGGIKIAASGELGIGVGEEDRGSGEREVLEGLVGRVDGLVDVLVSKFGDSDPDDFSKTGENKKEHGQGPVAAQWLGSGKGPGAEDGAIFLGVGALSRKSVRDIMQWMEDMYTWGENAYGVMESPKAARRAFAPPVEQAREGRRKSSAPAMQVPPNLFAPKRGSKTAGNTTSPRHASPASKTSLPNESTEGTSEEGPGLERYMDYLKLGYGKYWSLGGNSETSPATTQRSDPDSPDQERPASKGDDTVGHFLIGHTGEIEEGWVEDPEDRRFALEHEAMNGRTMVRTLTVEVESNALSGSESNLTKVLGSHDNELSSEFGGGGSRASFDNQDRNKTERLRVVVYVAKPFIFTFLFTIRTESLAYEGLYRSLHHQLGPLRKLLSRSTAYRPDRPDMGKTAAVIYDLVWDPHAITVHSTIPNIPDPGDFYSIHDPPPWSRLEALNTHMQILNLFNATRTHVSEVERTCKTSRGWWIVWSRILERVIEDPAKSSSSTILGNRPPSPPAQQQDEENGKSSSASNVTSSEGNIMSVPSTASGASSTILQDLHQQVSKEIFLVRKASDHAGGHGRSVSLTAAVGGGAGWADGASRLAQGIGVDTKRYIEGLLSLNR